MTQLKQPLPDLLGTAFASAERRRAPLLEAMRNLGTASIGCHGCTGLCCTFVANSVQVTPLEAVDLWMHLAATGRATAGERDKLSANVARFSLDRPLPGVGNRDLLRRRYTCPFYASDHAGFSCSIKREQKPYGCLGFNPTRLAVKDGEGCSSDQTMLALRETSESEETALNAAAAKSLGVTWSAKSIPVALLEIWDSMIALTDQPTALDKPTVPKPPAGRD